MTKYYFFKTVRIEGRQKLRALPNQTTYKDYTHRNEPVNTNWDVQTERAARTVQCSYPDGTIFVVKIEGDRDINTKLLVHSRNGQQFYRVEEMTYPILQEESYLNREDIPAEDMLIAYDSYMSTVQGTTTDAADESNHEPTEENHPSGRMILTISDMLKLGNIPKEDNYRLMNAVPGSLNNCILKFRDEICLGIICFEYQKQNGENRIAYGTRNTSLIPSGLSEAPHSSGANDDNQINYFDIQKNGWRSFRLEKFLGIITNFKLTRNAAAVPAL